MRDVHVAWPLPYARCSHLLDPPSNGFDYSKNKTFYRSSGSPDTRRNITLRSFNSTRCTNFLQILESHYGLFATLGSYSQNLKHRQLCELGFDQAAPRQLRCASWRLSIRVSKQKALWALFSVLLSATLTAPRSSSPIICVVNLITVASLGVLATNQPWRQRVLDVNPAVSL